MSGEEAHGEHAHDESAQQGTQQAPQDGPSFGEQFHGKGCKPCRFFFGNGCNWGGACKFCHREEHRLDKTHLHDSGMCRPCREFPGPNGCQFSEKCHFCHDPSHVNGTAPPRRFDPARGGFRGGFDRGLPPGGFVQPYGFVPRGGYRGGFRGGRGRGGDRGGERPPQAQPAPAAGGSDDGFTQVTRGSRPQGGRGGWRA